MKRLLQPYQVRSPLGQKRRERTIRITSATDPQRAFWDTMARHRLFVGGLGSGKTYAGVVEVLRQPPGSYGMVLAPTYPMLRDATLRTFLELAGELVADFHRSEMRVKLTDGKTILFRSAEKPDRLRGPNLGWFWLDEAALMPQEVWLIMLGRLREHPGRAWATTTPRGKNWLYEAFLNPDHAVIRSSTRQNIYLPQTFVSTLEQAYTSEWQRQEIEGEFVDPAGALFRREWFRVVDTAPEGLWWVRYWDLAASTKSSADYTASVAVAMDHRDGCIYIRDMIRGRWEWPDARRVMVQTMQAEPNGYHVVEKALHGLAALQELRREPGVSHVALRGVDVDRDKLTRALPWAARAEAGKVALVRGNWVGAFLDEAVQFPNGQHDDQIDAVSGALPLLARNNSALGAFQGVR